MRHPFSALKGFRKFFKTMSYKMVATNVEYMIGHIHGVAAHYYRAESVIDLVMQDYAKAIDDLTNQGCFRANSGVSDINGKPVDALNAIRSRYYVNAVAHEANPPYPCLESKEHKYRPVWQKDPKLKRMLTYGMCTSG
jgi:hypothetical protein